MCVCRKPPELFSKIQGPSEVSTHPWSQQPWDTAQSRQETLDSQGQLPSWSILLDHAGRYVFLDIYTVTSTTLTKPNWLHPKYTERLLYFQSELTISQYYVEMLRINVLIRSLKTGHVVKLREPGSEPRVSVMWLRGCHSLWKSQLLWIKELAMDDFTKFPQGLAQSRNSRRICSIKIVSYFTMKDYQENTTGQEMLLTSGNQRFSTN